MNSIFVNPALAIQCFPECGNLNYGIVFKKLAQKCGPLKECLEVGKRISEIESFQMSATDGFTSRVFRCKVLLENGHGPNDDVVGPPFSFILKVFSLDRANSVMANFLGEEKMTELLEEMGKMKIAKKEEEGGCKSEEKTIGEQNSAALNHSFFTRMHQNECAFYELMDASVADEGQQCPVPIPKIYFTQLGIAAGGQTDEHGLIAMEDFPDAHLADYVDGLNHEQLRTALCSVGVDEAIQVLLLTAKLANLHAHMIGMRGGHNWQSIFKTYDELFRDENNSTEGVGKWMKKMKEQLKDDERMAMPLKRLGRMFQGMEFFKWAEKKLEEELGIPEMLVHGDLCMNNILWQNKDPNQLAALIDWQLTQKGNPMTDIARLTGINMEPELRHELEKDNCLLGHYLKILNQKLVEMGMEPVKYGAEQLAMAYDLAMVGSSIGCAMLVPFSQRVWADMPDRDERLGRIGRRAQVAMVDVVEKMESLAPEWLLPADMPEKGATNE